jgi:hypothetical protein
VKVGSKESKTRATLIAVGIGIAVIAVVILVFGKGESKSKSACALDRVGVGTISEGLTHGRDTWGIMSTTAEFVVPRACKPLVAAFVDEPTTEVDFTFVSPTEGEVEKSVSGVELIQPAAEPPSSPAQSPEAQRLIDCFASYGDTEFLDQLCVEGLIKPF